MAEIVPILHSLLSEFNHELSHGNLLVFGDLYRIEQITNGFSSYGSSSSLLLADPHEDLMSVCGHLMIFSPMNHCRHGTI